MPRPKTEDLDGTPFEGDRPGAHPVDVLGELPIDGDPVGEEQLMTDAELDPNEVEGDRFDVGDDDLGHAPDLEADPGAPDLQPDTVERFAEADADGEPDEDQVEERLSARPSGRSDRDVLVQPSEPDELP